MVDKKHSLVTLEPRLLLLRNNILVYFIPVGKRWVHKVNAFYQIINAQFYMFNDAKIYIKLISNGAKI